MRLSKLRKSRLTATLVAAAWLPYMAICCVAAAGDSGGPGCHMLAGLLAATAEAAAPSGLDGTLHEAASHDTGSRPDCHRDQQPEQACCDNSSRTIVTIEQGFDFDAQPAVVVVALPLPPATFPVRSAPLRVVDVCDHDPPRYLAHSSFLI